MKNTINELSTLFDEAKANIEFEFVQTLINYKGMGAKELSTNLHEWFDAIEFYKQIYYSKTNKEKTRIGLLLYSTFFENSDFYNILGSLCKIKLGYRGSSYLFWKTKKYERLLGIGEKKEFLLELLEDADKQNMISFFTENHFKEIRNTFFHSAYSLSEEDYFLHDSDPIVIDGVGTYRFNVKEFLYPKIENVIQFFDTFKQLYLDSFDSYQDDKEVDAFYPNPCKATILGSKDGLKGFRIKNAVNFFGKWHDSGVWYDEKYDMWAGHNIRMSHADIETIEINDSLTRYENKEDIKRSDLEFENIVDKIVERNNPTEIYRATDLLVKFGDIRLKKMIAEKNGYKQRNFPKIILPFYKQAVEIGSKIMDMKQVSKNIKTLEEFMAGS
ncbi:hypothetical protein CLV86_0159 [Lacinutrix venerupis]|uniref:hypothetical protein n=1 Tax=Lacinutrix venerupis TaxID=1486034 RepID=UPI000EAD515A|nr:hypothetical protein [Lacinutrix venerupis]RLJ68770.1 hypothetical protein CLV86_0159 [Lacinutrix venerupis]